MTFLLLRYTVIIPLDESAFALSVRGVFARAFWQPVSYLFVHGGWSHLIFNMIALLFFGIPVEKALGSKEFTILYFFTGIFAGLFSVALFYTLGLFQISQGMYPVAWLYQLVGASGAIYGILLTYATIFPSSRIFIYGIIPVPAPLLVVIYTFIEFFSQFSSTTNVAHCTHLAGFGFAFLYILIRMGVNPIKIWKDTYKR